VRVIICVCVMCLHVCASFVSSLDRACVVSGGDGVVGGESFCGGGDGGGGGGDGVG
jgi:hypothetical protein